MTANVTSQTGMEQTLIKVKHITKQFLPIGDKMTNRKLNLKSAVEWSDVFSAEPFI